MRQGVPTPQYVIDFIASTMRDVPGITVRSMTERIREEFGIKIDQSTVRRKIKSCREMMLDETAAAVVQDAKAVLPNTRMRRHQADLLRLTVDLRTAVRSYPSIGLEPIQPPGEHPPVIPAPGVEALLWEGFQAHLEGNQLMGCLAEWRSDAERFAEVLNGACEASIPVAERVFGMPLRSDGVLPFLGIHFSTCVGKAILSEIENEGPVSLTWNDPGTLLFQGRSYIARGLDMDLEEAKSRFFSVVREVMGNGVSQKIYAARSALRDSATALDTRLSLCILCRELPGSCLICE